MNKKCTIFLKSVIVIGRRKGGYILMDSGEIAEDISKEKYDYYQ
jgi:hypothetical protein